MHNFAATTEKKGMMWKSHEKWVKSVASEAVLCLRMGENVDVDCHSLSHTDTNFTPLAEDREPPHASNPINFYEIHYIMETHTDKRTHVT